MRPRLAALSWGDWSVLGRRQLQPSLCPLSCSLQIIEKALKWEPRNASPSPERTVDKSFHTEDKTSASAPARLGAGLASLATPIHVWISQSSRCCRNGVGNGGRGTETYIGWKTFILPHQNIKNKILLLSVIYNRKTFQHHTNHERSYLYIKQSSLCGTHLT